jgi:hypothetical protein
MRTKLDLIEARLQALIESSVALFARGDAQHRLAHQLVEAAQMNLQTGPDGRSIAPDLYLIYLHPGALASWTSHGNLIDSIGKTLRDVAREYGVYFNHDPQIQLQSDIHLSLEGIRVEALDQPDQAGQTPLLPSPPLRRSAPSQPMPS